jgi:hypothetical protein
MNQRDLNSYCIQLRGFFSSIAVISTVDVEEKIWNHSQQPDTIYIGVHGWFESSVHLITGGR